MYRLTLSHTIVTPRTAGIIAMYLWFDNEIETEQNVDVPNNNVVYQAI